MTRWLRRISCVVLISVWQIRLSLPFSVPLNRSRPRLLLCRAFALPVVSLVTPHMASAVLATSDRGPPSMAAAAAATYAARASLKQNQRGPHYQVLVALHHMLQLLEQQTPFDARLELEGVGALDDVVITTWNATRTTQLRQLFLQLKHANDADAKHLRWEDFVNKTGHFEVWKYFDDWFLFLCSGVMPAAGTPATLAVAPAAAAVPRDCVYYTNRNFQHLLPCLVADGPHGLRFTDAFVNAAAPPSDFAKLLSAIKKHSFVCNAALTKKKNKNDQIVDDNNKSNPTMNAARDWYQSGKQALDDAQLQHCLRVFLREHFRLRVGEPSVDELQPVVRSQVASYFPAASDVDAIFHALLHSASAWFRELGVSVTWTETIVRAKLSIFHAHFNALPAHMGRGACELEALAQGFIVARLDYFAATMAKLDSSAQCAAWLCGERGLGKSTLVAHHLLHCGPLKPGEYLYFSDATRFLAEHSQLLLLAFLSLVVVDDADPGDARWAAVYTSLQACGKRLVLISSAAPAASAPPAFEVVPFGPLSLDEVRAYLVDTNQIERYVSIGRKQFKLADVLLEPRDDDVVLSGFQHCAQVPSALVHLCAASAPFAPVPALSFNLHQSATESSSRYLPSAVEHPSSFDIEPIPLRGKQQIPLYSCEQLATLADFHGCKVAACATTAAAQRVYAHVDQRIAARKQAPEDSKARATAASESDADARVNEACLDLSALGYLSSLASVSTFLAESLPNVTLRGKFNRDDLHLTLLDATHRVQQWSQDQRSELAQLNVMLIVTEAQQAETAAAAASAVPAAAASAVPAAAGVLATAEFASGLAHHFALHSTAPPLFRAVTPVFRLLPRGTCAILEHEDSPLLVTLASTQAVAQGTLLVAEAGSGKSTSVRHLHEQFIYAAENCWGGRYRYLAYAPFRALCALPLAWTLLDLACHLLLDTAASVGDASSRHTVLREVLEIDLRSGVILFLLDGWDEVGHVERAAAAPLLALLRHYRHLIVTTRHTDEHNLFFQPGASYQLMRFSETDIAEFVKRFFHAAAANLRLTEQQRARSEQFVQDCSKYLAGGLDLIGLPLQCCLVCCAWRDAWEQYCLHDDASTSVALPWHRGVPLSRVELFQLFVLSRLRKEMWMRYHQQRAATADAPDADASGSSPASPALLLAGDLPDDEVCTLGMEFTKALQRAAFGFLFHQQQLRFAQDWFAEVVRRMELVDESAGEFKHKTYAEYLAAVQLVRMLDSHNTEAMRVFATYRYQLQFTLVFEFAAGIVSRGDPSLPGATSLRGHFWRALLQEPRDLVGSVDAALVHRCASYRERPPAGKRQLGDFRRHSHDEHGLHDPHAGHSASPNSSQSQLLAFVQPKWVRDYPLYGSNIRDIPVASLSPQGKADALQWLHTTLTSYAPRSYRVSEACLDMIAAIGFATLDAATVRKFVSLIVSCLGGHWNTVAESAVLALMTLHADLNTFTAERRANAIDAVISKLHTLSELPSGGLEWLLHQPELSAAQFEAIQAKLAALCSDTGRMDPVVAMRILRRVNEPLVLEMAGAEWQGQPIQCFALLELVTSGAAQHAYADTLFQSLAKIPDADFMKLGAWSYPLQLLRPVQQWLDRAPVGDQYRAAWLEQVVRAAMAAVSDYENRSTVPILMGLLPLLRPSQSQMEPVLDALFSPKITGSGFWFEDAVEPSIQSLAPYFCLSFARLVTRWARRRILLKLDRFQQASVAKQLTEPGRQCLVRACLEILAVRTVARDDPEQAFLLRYDDPIAYLVDVEPATVLPILLDVQAEPLLDKNAGVIALAHRVECFRRYAALKEFAITATVDRDAGGCALHLFVSDKHMQLPASPEFIQEVQKLKLAKVRRMYNEAALQAHVPASHAAASSVFVVQSPWALRSPSDSECASSASDSEESAPLVLDGSESSHSEADEEPQDSAEDGSSKGPVAADAAARAKPRPPQTAAAAPAAAASSGNNDAAVMAARRHKRRGAPDSPPTSASGSVPAAASSSVRPKKARHQAAASAAAASSAHPASVSASSHSMELYPAEHATDDEKH